MAGINYGFTTSPEDAALIKKLSAHHQQALAWTGTYAGMATELRVAVGTIKSRRNRARNALRALRQSEEG